MTTQEWIQGAIEAATAVASRMPEFTTEDVWEELQRRGISEPETNFSARMMSHPIVWLRRRGFIEKADKKPVPHRDVRGVGRASHPIPVWTSHLYRKAE